MRVFCSDVTNTYTHIRAHIKKKNVIYFLLHSQSQNWNVSLDIIKGNWYFFFEFSFNSQKCYSHLSEKTTIWLYFVVIFVLNAVDKIFSFFSRPNIQIICLYYLMNVSCIFFFVFQQTISDISFYLYILTHWRCSICVNYARVLSA